MSRIITYLKCKHCGTEYRDIYVSFGHPDKGFTWVWECKECGKENDCYIRGEYELFSDSKSDYMYNIDRWK